MKIAGTLAADVLLGGGCISRLDTPLATSEAAAPLTEEERQQRDEEYRLRELENWRRELSAANLSLAEEADFYAYRADGLYYINDEATDRETARTAYQFVADNLASVGHETPIGALLNKNVKVVDDRLWFLFDLNSEEKKAFTRPNTLTSLAWNMTADGIYGAIRHNISNIPKEGTLLLKWEFVTKDSLFPGGIYGSDIMTELILRLAENQRMGNTTLEGYMIAPLLRQHFLELTIGDQKDDPAGAFNSVQEELRQVSPDDLNPGGLLFRHPTLYRADFFDQNNFRRLLTGELLTADPSAYVASGAQITHGTPVRILGFAPGPGYKISHKIDGILPVYEPRIYAKICLPIHPPTNRSNITELRNQVTVDNVFTNYWVDVENLAVAIMQWPD